VANADERAFANRTTDREDFCGEPRSKRQCLPLWESVNQNFRLTGRQEGVFNVGWCSRYLNSKSYDG